MLHKDYLRKQKERILKIVEISHKDFIYGFEKPEDKVLKNIKPLVVHPFGKYPTENYTVDGITFVIQNLDWAYSVVFFPSSMDDSYLNGRLDESWGWEYWPRRGDNYLETLLEAFCELSNI